MTADELQTTEFLAYFRVQTANAFSPQERNKIAYNFRMSDARLKRLTTYMYLYNSEYDRAEILKLSRLETGNNLCRVGFSGCPHKRQLISSSTTRLLELHCNVHHVL
jgi:hypothetical protein